MKTFTWLLFATIILVNPVVAQQVNPGQKVIPKNQNAQNNLKSLKMARSFSNLNLPFIFPKKQRPLLKSASSIKLDSIVISKRDVVTKPWSNYNKLIFEYDAENFQVSKIVSIAGLDDEIDCPETATFKYNSNGLLESAKVTGYPSDRTLLTINFEFSYDTSGKLLKAYSYYNGELSIGKNYFYNDLGLVVEILMEENWWSYWTSLHYFSYDSKGKLAQYTEGVWYSILATYQWNIEGNLIQENYRNWYQDWENKYKYNSDGDRIESEWYWLGSSEFPEFRIEKYEYLDIPSDGLVSIDLSQISLSNEVDEIAYFPKKLISKSYTDTKMTEYYYSTVTDGKSLVSAAGDKKVAEFNVFPNPANDKITITWNQYGDRLNLKIFQLTGSCVLEKEVTSNETVNLGKLPAGVYVYKVFDKNQMLNTGKLVIR